MYVSLSKNEGESFAVSFSLCFLLRESHPDCDFEGGWREWMLLSHFPSNNVQQHPQTRKMSNVGCKPVRVQSFECKGTTFPLRFTNFLSTFFIFFSTEPFSPVNDFNHIKRRNKNCQPKSGKDYILLQCCSVAVLKKPFPYAKNSSISIYIDIEFISYFHTTIFWTATLQHCNAIYILNIHICLIFSVLWWIQKASK